MLNSEQAENAKLANGWFKRSDPKEKQVAHIAEDNRIRQEFHAYLKATHLDGLSPDIDDDIWQGHIVNGFLNYEYHDFIDAENEYRTLANMCRKAIALSKKN